MNEKSTIVLISPQVVGERNQVRKAQPPLGITYIAAVLEENGYKDHVHLIDAVVEDYDNVEDLIDDDLFIKYGLNDESLAEKVISLNADIVGISALFSSQTECAFSLGEMIKEKKPDVTLVMGGNHVSNTYISTLRRNKYIDYVLRGESDFSFLDFVERFDSKQDLHTVAGLSWIGEDGEINSNPVAPFVKNLDVLPDPAFHLLPMERYFEIAMPHNPFVKSGRVASLMTSRGCPEHCYFCTSPTYTGTAFRSMSAKRVVDQIHSFVERYDVKEIQILDDNFTVNHRRVIEICEGIHHLNLRITLPNAIRGDRPLDHVKRLRMYKAMKKAGVEQFGISVEHGDQDFLDHTIKKKLDLEEVKITCELAHEAGILVHANFMMGFPGESRELIQKTIDYAHSLDADSFSVSLASPLPGTPMWDVVEKNNLFVDNYNINRMVYVDVSIKPKDVSEEELRVLADQLNSDLNRSAQNKRQASREKYERFKKSGKTASGDRKYEFT